MSKATIDLEKDKFASDGSVKISGAFGGGGKTTYTQAQITALSSSTDINAWTDAYNDGQLLKQYVQEYDTGNEKITYYTHPSLTSGKCLKITRLYTTVNATRVISSETPSVSDWTFETNLAGTISLSLGTVVSPAADATAGTTVCTLTYNDSGDTANATYQFNITGTNSNLYRFNNTTQGVTSASLDSSNFTYGDVVKIETASNFANVNYNHSLTVSFTDDVDGLQVTQSLATSASVIDTFGNEFYLQGVSTTTKQDDYAIVGTEKSLFPSANSGTSYFPSHSSAWSISFYIKMVGSATSYSAVWQMINGTATQFRLLVNVGNPDSIALIYNSSSRARESWFYVNNSGLSTGDWVHCVITRASGGNTLTASDHALYIDGTHHSFTENTFHGGHVVASDFANATVAKTTFGGAFYNSITGAFGSRKLIANSFDQIKTWDIELTQTQVTELYNSGKPKDTSTLSFASNIDAEFLCGDGSNDNVANHQAYDTQDSTRYIAKIGGGTFGIQQLTMDDSIYDSVTGNHKYVQSPAVYSLSGGDTNGYNQPTGRIGAYQNTDSSKRLFGAASSNATVSVSLWYNQAATPSPTPHALLTAFLIPTSNTTHSQQWSLVADTSDVFFHANSGPLTNSYQSAGSAITDNVWRHVVVTIETDPNNSSNYLPKIYINGTLQTLTTGGTLAKSNVPYIFDTTNYTNYGFAINGTYNANDGHAAVGSNNANQIRIDEVSTYNIALSQSQVTAIYNNGSPTDLTGHTGIEHWFRMGDGPNDTPTSIACNFHPSTTMTSLQDYTQNH